MFNGNLLSLPIIVVYVPRMKLAFNTSSYLSSQFSELHAVRTNPNQRIISSIMKSNYVKNRWFRNWVSNFCHWLLLSPLCFLCPSTK